MHKRKKKHKFLVKRDRLVVAVISDIHAYEGVAADDAPSHCCVTENDPTKNSLVGLRDLIRDLKKKENLTADLLFSPGDLGEKAQPVAIQHVWRELHDLKTLLRAKELIVTTGNHDIDSRFAHNDHDAKGMLQSLEPRYPFADERLTDQYWARHFVGSSGIRAFCS
jgi:Calcineurin-like phosphoesterase